MRWLHSCPPKPAPRPTPQRRRFLIVSLLTKNPTSAAKQGGITHGSESTPGVTTRARSRRIAAASAGLHLPDEILVWEIFVRLPAKDIIRCGAVSHSWRGLTSTADFLLSHHRRQPSRLLVMLCGKDSTKGSLPIVDRGSPVLGFDDYFGFELHASCDGLLLVSLSDGRFNICNPATRQRAPVPGLTDVLHVEAMYLHHPSGEYRVLYWKRRYTDMQPDADYYILTVPLGGSSRCITVTSPSPDMEKVMIEWKRMALGSLPSPVVFGNCLHWDPDWIDNDAGIVIFDTVAESFRIMRRPASATSFCLCDMEGLIGFSCFDDDGLDDDGQKIAKIWVLEDYEREIWAFKYQIKFPMESLCDVPATQHLVLNPEGYLVVYNECEIYMFYLDSTGKLLDDFRWRPPHSTMIGHWFKESLVRHEFFPRRGGARAGQPNLFRRL